MALSAQDLTALAAVPCEIKTLQRGQYLTREGEQASACHLLISGFAHRHKLTGSGSRQILSIHIPGDFADLDNFLLEVADHNVQCLTACDLAVIPKKALVDLASSNPPIGRALWLDTLVDSSVFREWIVNVGRRDARARIAHLLCELATRLDAASGALTPVHHFPFTQDHIADATGLTAVHTNRTLQSLRKEGLIALSGGKLTILNWDGLRTVGDFSDRYLHHAA